MRLETILNEDLLLELAEKLKRHEAYGSWIDTNTGKIYDIPRMGGHADFIQERMDAWGIPKHAVKKSDDYYTIGFAKGLVRTVHRPRFELTVDGLSKDLKKIVPVIMASAVQEDVTGVRINKVIKLGDPATNMKYFQMPGQKGELQFFLSK